MGPPPGACSNLYDGVITSFTIDGQPVIQNHTYTMQIPANNSIPAYNFSMTIHIPSRSETGNKDNGSLWYHENIGGYPQGACAGPYRHGQDAVIASPIGVPGVGYPAHPPVTQSVQWYTANSNFTITSEVDYQILWVAPSQSSSSASSISMSTTTQTASSTRERDRVIGEPDSSSSSSSSAQTITTAFPSQTSSSLPSTSSTSSPFHRCLCHLLPALG